MQNIQHRKNVCCATMLLSTLFFTIMHAAVLAVFFPGEKVSLRRWLAIATVIAIAIGFTGVVIIIRPGIQPVELGTFLVLGSAAIRAMTIIIIKRLSDNDSSTTANRNNFCNEHANLNHLLAIGDSNASATNVTVRTG